MNPKPFIIIGASHWHAPWHFAALLGAGQTVAAVGDISGAAGHRLVGDRTIPVHENWRELIREHPDAIAFVLTPPNETPEVLAALVENDMPIVLEKPGTLDAPSLRPIVAAAERKGLPTAVPFVNRYMSFWRELELRDPKFQDWTHAHFRILAGPPERYIRDGVPWVLSRKRYGGGALRNLGIHTADAALALTGGKKPVVERALLSNALHGLEVEDFATAMLRTGNGARTITIEAGYCMPTETTADKQWRIHGPGWAVSEERAELTIRSLTGLEKRPTLASADHYDLFGSEMRRMSLGIDHGMATLGDLLAAQVLIDDIYAAARSS
ncbi:Gfo/Idh/MocA family protein [Neorhizobium sp. DT-125]|uniref:Gfo/Idh/MocA family protein n=1 Tax=Neorhizobium sp. DT-125 TaxID=3396163 RepID=UPI003F1BB652